MNINSNKYNWWTLLLVACAIFSACEKQPTATTQNAISFGSGRKQAPSTINANARLWGYTTGTNGYWVFAGATTDGLTEGADAEYTKNESTGTLTPAVTRYWADNQTYNFYSVWPVVDDNGISDIAFNKANSELTFKIADISAQNDNTDFCIAAALDEEGGADRERDVQMTYKHALSKVQFYGFSSGITAQLTNFTITVPKSATAVCTLTTNTLAATETTENALDINYPFVDSDNNTTNGVDSISLVSELPTGQEYFFLNEQNETTNPNGTFVLEKLVLPMQQGGTFHVAATYKIGDNNKTVETDITATWQPGKNYIYKFKIQPSGPIIFGGVSVTEWNYVTGETQTENSGITSDITLPTEP